MQRNGASQMHGSSLLGIMMLALLPAGLEAAASQHHQVLFRSTGLSTPPSCCSAASSCCSLGSSSCQLGWQQQQRMP